MCARLSVLAHWLAHGAARACTPGRARARQASVSDLLCDGGLRENRLVLHAAVARTDRDEKEIAGSDRLVLEPVDALRPHRGGRSEEHQRERRATGGWRARSAAERRRFDQRHL